MAELYIYYQVRDEHAAVLAPRVLAMQAGLAASEGVHGRLLRRPASRDGVQTWMEIYPASSDGFDAALAAALDLAAVPSLIAGQRHTEVFTDISTCA